MTSSPSTSLFARGLLCGLACILVAGEAHADVRTVAADVRQWRIVPRESGPIDYYRVVQDGDGVYLRSDYKPGYTTAVRGFKIPDSDRRAWHKLRWRWRAITAPVGANECVKGRGDSPAAVYATWRRGLKWYALKFVWSSGAPRGVACDPKNLLFYRQQTVVLESGGPLGSWATEEVDLDGEFRRYFANGDRGAEVPDFIGIGVMSDGDQTHSESSADFADFTLSDG